jgi:polyisoprenoid-binding protein YceI
MRTSFLIAVAVAAPLAAQDLPARYNIDASHSSVGFVVGFMGMSTVRGGFSSYEGTIMYDAREPTRSSVSVQIAVSSINSNARQRDEHLRSPDFFDAAKYPLITFRSTRIARAPGGAGFVAHGVLTMHGQSREVDIPFERLNGPMPDAWGNQRMTLRGTLAVSRKAWGILGTAFWNSEFDPGRMAVSDRADLELLVSATIPNVERWAHPVGDSLLASVERDGADEAARRFRATYAENRRVDSIPEFAFVDAGQKLVTRGRAADAIALYRAVLDVRPAATTTRFLLGEAYLKAGRVAEARETFERARRDDPDATGPAEWLRVLDDRRP